MNLAQFNIGRLRASLDSPQIADFKANLDRINEMADASPGFVWRLIAANDTGATSLHPYGDELVIVNLSVWRSIETVRGYVYHSEHLDFLRRRRDWFEKMAAEHQALWWMPDGMPPTLDEAMERLELVRRNGSAPEAFTFRDPYPDPDTLAAQR
jgi:hypothetical protein